MLVSAGSTPGVPESRVARCGALGLAHAVIVSGKTGVWLAMNAQAMIRKS